MRTRPGGFTLVEILLAVAVAIIALLPLGLMFMAGARAAARAAARERAVLVARQALAAVEAYAESRRAADGSLDFGMDLATRPARVEGLAAGRLASEDAHWAYRCRIDRDPAWCDPASNEDHRGVCRVTISVEHTTAGRTREVLRAKTLVGDR